MYPKGPKEGKGMAHVLIITGGGAPRSIEVIDLGEYDMVIAADSGIEAAERYGLAVDLWVGDFDSVSIKPTFTGETVYRDHRVKLESDTELALQAALERKMTSYTLLGGGGYRFDHLLVTYALFEKYGVPTAWHTKYESMYSVTSHRTIERRAGQTVSILPAYGSGKSIVTAPNLRWPLREYPLTHASISLSNEMIEKPLTVQVSGDPIFICFPVADLL